MDQATISALLKFMAGLSPSVLLSMFALLIATPFGVVVLVLFFYFANERRQQDVLLRYRDDMQSVLKAYGEDVKRLSLFYENNVELVKSWERMAEGFQSTVVLNTATMQQLSGDIKTNQYCPAARLPK